MKNNPVVSVIMPLYNKRPYVKRAINSVRKQTLAEWELIIVDDGSTDGSTDEIPQNEPRIRFFQQSNAGPAAARNHGIRKARGEFITFIDADDYYYPHKLKHEMALLQKENMAEWMVSAFEYETNNHVITRYIRDVQGKEINGEPLVFDNASLQLTVKGWHIDGLCMKKSLFDRLGGFREGMRCFEITDLLIRCAVVQPQLLISPLPLFRVVDVPGSAFKVAWHRTEGIRQMGENLHALSAEHPELAHIFTPKSRKQLLFYVAALIQGQRSGEARKYLTHTFPYSRDKRWWKIWILTWIPQWLIEARRRLGSASVEFNETTM